MHIGINGLVMAFITMISGRRERGGGKLVLLPRERAGLRASDGENEVLDRMPLNLSPERQRKREGEKKKERAMRIYV